MIDASSLSVFVVAVILLLVVPGPNMAFVMTHAIAHGWQAGLAAALGITVADLMMTAMVSVGVGALIMSWAPAFELIRWAGAGYLLWLGWIALKAPPADSEDVQAPLASMHSIFARATLNSLLNPKALFFFMVFLPQFVSPYRGNAAVQLMLLGMVLAVIAFLFHFLLGLCAGAVHQKMRGLPFARRFGSYGFAAVMAALAARLVLLDRPQ